MRENERNRRKRFFREGNIQQILLNSTTIATNKTTHKRTSDRTTYVLILMLIVFLLTELPQGLFAILNGFVFIFKKYFMIKKSQKNFFFNYINPLFKKNCTVKFV